ncbi:zinc finger zz-type [Pyrenophora seminiperda CCB06]|uniref:Zinc finger zz-type n=1 Tax=Pyrenophora seminiperda CCB06 TaxID=1302712 RepID=A0A3M7LX69_9PLEO|nr:zinc finger zz-type [Pyrenophora seminiperda CCB06]
MFSVATSHRAMPSLKDLNCAIELSESQNALQEFGTIYGDGFVETFVPVPSKPQSFSVHITSNKFIAPGIAIFVYVDGVYQCNRNRQDLKLRKPSDSRSLVDFRVRQKEEKRKDGSMIAREWAFDKLNIASADDAPNLCSPNILENIGCIEVIVLRCAGSRNAQSASTMNLDGAGDPPNHYLGVDRSSSQSNGKSMYDDRSPLFNNLNSVFRPPPPLSSHRQPYAETERSYEASSSSRNRRSTHNALDVSPRASVTQRTQIRSRYTESVSPGARRTSDLPSSGFEYGSGPIPRDRELFHQRAADAGTPQVPFQDTEWLNKVITTAVKQGLEESRRVETQSDGHVGNKKGHFDLETKSDLPGAWPASPVAAAPEPYKRSEPAAVSVHARDSDHGSNWNHSQDGWSQQKPQSRAGTRVTWNAESLSETESSSGHGWKLHEETPSDSWDTEETWATDKAHGWEAADPPTGSQAPAVLSHYNVKAIPPITLGIHDRQLSKHSSRRQKSRSRPHKKHSSRANEVTSSSSESTGYAYIERPSDSVIALSSSDETLRASRSRTYVPHVTKGKAKSHARRTKSTHQGDERRSSQALRHAPSSQPTKIHHASTPPMRTHVTPNVMNLPVHPIPTQTPPQQLSMYAESAVQVAPHSTWDPEAFDLTGNQSSVGNIFPPPYATTLNDLKNSTAGVKQQGKRSLASSTWGSVKKAETVKDSWGDDVEKKSGWGSAGDSGWEEKEPEPQGKNGWTSADEPTNDDQADNGWGEKEPGPQGKNGWTSADEPTNDNQADNGWSNNENNKKVEFSAWETKDNSWGMKQDGAALKDDWDTNDNGWETKNNDWSSLRVSNPDERKKKEKNADVTSQQSALTKEFKKTSVSEVPWQTQTWDFQDSKDKQEGMPWDNIKPAAPTLAEEPPEKAASASCRHSNKSLSKYRLRSHSGDLTTPKPHCQFPPPPSSHKLRTISEDQTYIAPKEPRYTIPEKVASEKGIEHQVRPGPATEYGHAVGRPEYMDRLDNPYAVFRFKYRSRSILKALFGDQIPDQEQHATPSSTEIKKDKLRQMPQDELVEKLLKMETKLREAKRLEETKHKHGHRNQDREKQRGKERTPSDRTEVVTKSLTEAWVQQQSRDPSEKAKSQTAKSTSKEQGEKTKRKENFNETWMKSGNVELGGGDIKW